LFVLKLGEFAESSVHVLSFVFDASSLVCSSIVTLVVFGAKNIVMSFARRGSLITLVSSVCCILLDADAFALLSWVLGAGDRIRQAQGERDRGAGAPQAGRIDRGAKLDATRARCHRSGACRRGFDPAATAIVASA
jgi:hypothetical protein